MNRGNEWWGPGGVVSWNSERGDARTKRCLEPQRLVIRLGRIYIIYRKGMKWTEGNRDRGEKKIREWESDSLQIEGVSHNLFRTTPGRFYIHLNHPLDLKSFFFFIAQICFRDKKKYLGTWWTLYLILNWRKWFFFFSIILLRYLSSCVL